MGLAKLIGPLRTQVKVSVDRSMTQAEANVRRSAKGQQKITKK
jgi:hypothetical protein